MLSGIRKFARSWAAVGIIALLVVGTVITGSQIDTGLLGGNHRNDVAWGNGFAVSSAEFDREIERVLTQQRNQTGQFVTRAELREQGAGAVVLDQIVQREAVDRFAARLGLHTSDAAVGRQIRDIPAFQSQITGTFDQDQYRQLLEQNGFTLEEFEEGLRAEMTRMQVLAGIGAGVRPPSSYGRFVAAFQGETRTVTVAEVPSPPGSAIPQPSDAEIQTYFEQNAARFATPELRSFTLAIADPAAFAQRVEVPESRVREVFEFRLADLSQPERRSFAQVTAPSEAAAKEATRRLRAGEEPGAVAQTIGGQHIPFDSVARNAVPDPAVAEAAFALRAGQTSEPVRGRLAWAAVRVNAVTTATAPDYGAMRDELRAEIAREDATDMMNTAVDQFEEAIAGGAALEDAARAAGLQVLTTPPVDERGVTGEGAPAPALAGQAGLLRAAFALEETESTDFEPLDDGRYVLARFDSLTPAGTQPLEAVKSRLVDEMRAQRAAARMREIAAEVASRVAAGASFERAARALGLNVLSRSEPINRGAALGGPLAELGAAVFGAAEGAVVSAPAPGQPSLLVAHVEAVQRVDPAANPALIEQARVAQKNLISQDILAVFQSGVIAAAQVKRNDELVARVLGETEDEPS